MMIYGAKNTLQYFIGRTLAAPDNTLQLIAQIIPQLSRILKEQTANIQIIKENCI